MTEMTERCYAMTRSNKRCKLGSQNDSFFCHRHQGFDPADSPALRHARSQGRFKLNDQLIDKFDQVLRAGNYVQTALAYLEVSESSFYRWMKKGQQLRESGEEVTRAEDLLQVRLWETVTRARAAAEIQAVTSLRQIAQESDDDRVRSQNWQWFLERGHRSRWWKTAIEVEHKGGVKLELDLPTPRVIEAEIIKTTYDEEDE